MKRSMTRMAALVLCLCLLATVSWAEDVRDEAEAYLLPTPENEYQSLISMTAAGDAAYILTANGMGAQLWRWREGMSQAEDLSDDLLYAPRFSSLEEYETVLQGMSASEREEAHPLSLVFTDGEQLYGYNGLNNAVFAIHAEADGLTLTEVGTLNYPQANSYLPPIDLVKADNWLLWFETDQNSRYYTERLLAFNLTSGAVKQAVLPDMVGISSYKDGKILVLCKESGEPYTLYAYDPATDLAEQVGTMEAQRIRHMSYSHALDMLIYQDRTRIMGLTPGGVPEQLGYIPTSQYAKLTALGDQLLYHTGNLKATTLQKGYTTEHSLTLMGGEMSNALLSFCTEYPEVPVYYTDVRKDETWQDIFARQQEMPDLKLVTSMQQYEEMLESGSLRDLSGSEALTAWADTLYPAFRELIRRDGGLYAIPVYAASYNGWYINKEVMTKMGLTAEDIPTSLTGLMEFAVKWNDEYAEKYPHFTLLNNTAEYRQRFFYAILDEWMEHCQATGAEINYNDPLLQECLSALDAARFDKLNAALNQTNPEVSEYKQALIWTGCKDVGNWASYMEDYSDRIFIPLTLTEETPYHAAIKDIRLWVVNAASANAEYAEAILAETIKHTDIKQTYVLSSEMTEPVENDSYAEMVDYELERLASMEASIEESVNKAAAEKRIAELKAYIENDLDGGRYLIHPSAIEHYRTVIAPAAFVYIPNTAAEDAQTEVLEHEYANGTITLEVFTTRMNELLK